MGFFMTFMCFVLAGALLHGAVLLLFVAARRFPWFFLHRRLVALYERDLARLADPEDSGRMSLAILTMWLLLPVGLSVGIGVVVLVPLPHHTAMMYLGTLAGGLMIGNNLSATLYILHEHRQARRRLA